MPDVTVANRWADIETLWTDAARTGRSTPFQQPRWLASWFATIGSDAAIEPLLVCVHDGDGPMLLPLVRRRHAGLVVIEPADLGVTDYNAPVIPAGRSFQQESATTIWSAVKTALPPADIIRLSKMPRIVDGAVNPLSLLGSARPSTLNGNVLTVEGEWSAYHHGLERTFRKEIERSWRVFERYPAAKFEMIREPTPALGVLRTLERQQAERMAELGKDYLLDEPRYEAHYRRLVEHGLADGSVRLSALSSQDTVVAALLGITHGQTFAMVRISTGGSEWKNCSPGRLVIYKTMEALHAEGLRHFDYTIGDYAYKRRMGAEPAALVDLVESASLKGWPVVLKDRLRARLRASPAVVALRAKLRPRAPAR